MVRLTELEAYQDEQGNEIVYVGRIEGRVRIKFSGSNNRLVVDPDAAIGRLVVDFDCDNGLLVIGASKGVPVFAAAIRIGQDSTVRIGRDVSATEPVAMSATEGTTITVGDDVMFASANQVRTDDGHPIFDVRSGKRVNTSRSIDIGNHVWLGRASVVLGGSKIGDGSVLGYGSILKGRVPNNAIAVGVPAQVRKRDIAWERPHLSLTKPYYKPDASTIRKSPYWQLTEVEDGPPSRSARLRKVAGRVKRRLRRITRRITRRRRIPS
jgi:acetyltransferase-like isoleucine patch superfamily enzyme